MTNIKEGTLKIICVCKGIDFLINSDGTILLGDAVLCNNIEEAITLCVLM